MPPATAPFSTMSRRVSGRSHEAGSRMSLILSSLSNICPPSEQRRSQHPHDLRGGRACVPNEMRDGGAVVDAVAGAERVLDPVDREHQLAREDVRELLPLVRVVVARVVLLAGRDRDEQRLERTLEVRGAEEAICMGTPDREPHVPLTSADMRRRRRLWRRLGEECAHPHAQGNRERVEGRQRDRRPSALDQRQEADRETGGAAEVAKRQTLFLAQRADRRPDPRELLARIAMGSGKPRPGNSRRADGAFYQTKRCSATPDARRTTRGASARRARRPAQPFHPPRAFPLALRAVGNDLNPSPLRPLDRMPRSPQERLDRIGFHDSKPPPKPARATSTRPVGRARPRRLSWTAAVDAARERRYPAAAHPRVSGPRSEAVSETDSSGSS